MKRSFYIAGLIFISLASTMFAQSEWIENSLNDFRDGSFLDAGSNSYVSAKGRVQMITRWDFNNDGYLDILMPAGHGHTEKENVYIYLNSGQDIDARSLIKLPAAGGYKGVVEDFNKDGYNDLAFANSADSHVERVPVWIYYGTENGYSPENRIELPSFHGSDLVTGDFNNDSFIDIALACQYFDEGDESRAKRSFVYWNSANGFSWDNRYELSFNGNGAQSLTAGNLDNDGICDLVAMAKGKVYLLLSSEKGFDTTSNIKELQVSGSQSAIGDFNNDSNPDIAIASKNLVKVIRGTQGGTFDLDDAIEIPISGLRDLVFTDADQDGYDDLVVANYSEPNGATWTNSALYYSNGKDFATRKPLQLPTLGASGVNCADLNGDNYPEIIFSCKQVVNLRNLYSYVYWNDHGVFRFENFTQLPTRGTNSNAIGDVNNDGLLDVVFFNDEGYFRDGPSKSYIYWGDGTRNYSKLRNTEILSYQTFGIGHADLDDDGNVDLVFTRQNFINGVPHEQAGLEIHWGEDKTYETITPLEMEFGYGGTRIADINKDGYLDIVAGGRCLDLNDPEKHGFPIFWGSKDGYSFKNRQVLHYKSNRLRGQLLMDLNKDGWLDIASQDSYGAAKIWWGSSNGFSDDNVFELQFGRNDQLMYLKAADFNKDGWLDLVCPQRGNPDGTETTSFIYYGSPEGYSNSNRFEISSYVPYQNTISDLNKDGWLDLLLVSYGGEVSGNRPALIYWGSENGFLHERTELECYGGSGSEILDYDGDGWLDILIANHRKAGSYQVPEPHHHTCPSMLYWGGPNGFSEKNRWEVTATGPSGLNLRDAGNSYDRGLYEDYTSSIHAIADNEYPTSIEWTAETPFGTDVHFQVRTAENESDILNAEWQGPSGTDTWFTESGTNLKNLKGKFIQYRARLITPNGAATPYLTGVKIKFK